MTLHATLIAAAGKIGDIKPDNSGPGNEGIQTLINLGGGYLLTASLLAGVVGIGLMMFGDQSGNGVISVAARRRLGAVFMGIAALGLLPSILRVVYAAFS